MSPDLISRAKGHLKTSIGNFRRSRSATPTPGAPPVQTTKNDSVAAVQDDHESEGTTQTVVERSPVLDLESTRIETGWAILKRVLNVVREGSDMCPPLKAALTGVTALMEQVDVRSYFWYLHVKRTQPLFQRVDDNQEGFVEIALKIERLKKIMDRYRSGASPLSHATQERLDKISS